MKQFEKKIEGIPVVKSLNEITIEADGMTTYCPTEEMVLADGWVEYVVPELTAEELLNAAKKKKIEMLYAYDSSDQINNCVIVFNDIELNYWANKVERDALKGAIHDCISMGRDVYRLDFRDKNVSISLRCDQLLQMLAELEIYAIDCYNKTTDHEFAIKSLTTIDEVDSYKFDSYPVMLKFEL